MIVKKIIKNNHIKWYIWGIKIFSYKNKNTAFDKNNVSIPNNVKVSIHIDGADNIISVLEQKMCQSLNIQINGCRNKVIIKEANHIAALDIHIGNHFPIYDSTIVIGKASWFGGVRIVLESDNSVISIGDDCVFSTGILIRNGEFPHLLFNKDTGMYLEKPTILDIGTHVWVGEKATLLSHTKISDGCIVGTRSVVTKAFEDKDSVIAGNPAKLCKKGIYWERDINALDKKSKYYKSYLLIKNMIRRNNDKH